jgi:hypothetical protein
MSNSKNISLIAKINFKIFRIQVIILLEEQEFKIIINQNFLQQISIFHVTINFFLPSS